MKWWKRKTKKMEIGAKFSIELRIKNSEESFMLSFLSLSQSVTIYGSYIYLGYRISLSCWLKLPYHAWLKFFPTDRDLLLVELDSVTSNLWLITKQRTQITSHKQWITFIYAYRILCRISMCVFTVMVIYCLFSWPTLYNWDSAFCVVNWYFVAPPTECNDTFFFVFVWTRLRLHACP